jgi:hypothetical protein
METDTIQQPDETIELPEQQQIDYFGFQQTSRYVFPDGITYFELKAMNEGEKSKFQKLTQRDLVLEKNSGNARFKMDPATERHELIKSSVVGWNLKRNGVDVPFPTGNQTNPALRDFLELANPKIVEDIELAIRKLNPWLLNDLTVEEIDKQIEELQDLRKAAVDKERGEAS